MLISTLVKSGLLYELNLMQPSEYASMRLGGKVESGAADTWSLAADGVLSTNTLLLYATVWMMLLALVLLHLQCPLHTNGFRPPV